MIKDNEFWSNLLFWSFEIAILISSLILVIAFEIKIMTDMQFDDLSLVFLLISNLTSCLRLHQFLEKKTTETNKSLKTDANGAN